MISLRRPTAAEIAGYREARCGSEPTCLPASATPAGFRNERFSQRIGTGEIDFERARTGLQQWQAHRGSGVEVHPNTSQLAVGETVAIVTRQLGLWVLAACRVTSVTDDVDVFGFIYASLPDHPECGFESFTVRCEDDGVRFEIEATSKAGIPLVRLGAPVTRHLQKRATDAYLDALAEWTAATASQGHSDMDLNNGVVTGDLRVLVTRTGQDLSHVSARSLIQSLLVGSGWKVTVSPADSPEVLAERRVGRRSAAERLRDEFVRVATEQKIDRTETSRIVRLLGT